MRATLCLIVLLALAGTACGPNIDLKASLQVADVSTGWADLGVVNGQNKIVPSITFTLKNASKVAGEEVVQLYTHDELASVARPVKELKGFQRVALAAGETRTVSFTLDAGMLTLFNEAMEEVTEPGIFRVMIGGSSKDIRLRAMVELKE